jgi:hypothetical protein
MIITGPNASGKTTILKSTLINIILTQQFGCGFYSSAKLSPFKHIHCYLNIPDTSGRDSLFQAEARRCKEILDIIVRNGKYKAFKLVDGSQVHKKYKNRIINNTNYSFPSHSAGPFGNDIDGQWLEEKNFSILLSIVGFGWKDIHCSLEDKSSKFYLPIQIIFYSKKKFIRRILKIIILFIVIYLVSRKIFF